MEKQNHLNVYGTYEEIKYAVSKIIKNFENENMKLPYLLQYYKDNFQIEDTNINITKRYNEENNLPEEFDSILRKAIFDD